MMKKSKKTKCYSLFFLGFFLFSPTGASADVVQAQSAAYEIRTWNSATWNQPNDGFSNFAIFIPTGTTFDRIQFAVPTVPGEGLWRPHLYFGGSYKLLLNAGYPAQTASTQISISSGNITRVATNTVQWVFSPVTVPADRTHVIFSIPRDGLDYSYMANFLFPDGSIKSASTTGSGNTNGATVTDGGPAYRLCNGPCDSFEPIPDFAIAESDYIDVPVSPLTFETKFTDATAIGAASTSISIDVDYFLKTSEYTPQNRPDMINVTVLADGFFSDRQVAGASRLILPLTDGNHTKNIPIEWIQDAGGFPDGNYIAYINFFNVNTTSPTFTNTNIVLKFEIDNGAVISSFIETLTTGEDAPPVAQYQDCSLTNLSGCFQNALIFAFVPDADALSRFTTLYQRIENKPPFGYVTSLKNALSGVSNTAVAAFDFGNIPFKTQIFDPFKGIMVIGLWLLYALYFMGRLNKLDI